MNTLFFRLLDSGDKATTLSEAVDAVCDGRLLKAVVHAVDPASFRQVPGSPFAYWVSDRLRRLFTKLPPFETEGRWARLGAHGSNDFRYVRCWWEVDCTQPHGLGEWRAFAKGGMFSPFYADIHLVVDWEPRRSTFLGFFGRPGREIERPESSALLPLSPHCRSGRMASRAGDACGTRWPKGQPRSWRAMTAGSCLHLPPSQTAAPSVSLCRCSSPARNWRSHTR